MSEPIIRSHRKRTSVSPRRIGVAAVLGGGLIGSAARGAVDHLVGPTSTGFPTATLLVNLSGSLLLGLFLSRRERAVSSSWSVRFWAIGLLGSFTTFSAFSLEVFRLADSGRIDSAAFYVALSTLGGLAAAILGERIGAGAQ